MPVKVSDYAVHQDRPRVAQTAQEAPEAAIYTFPWKKAVALMLWLLGAYCTQQVAAVKFSFWVAWGAALLIQAGLSMLESPLWRREDWDGYARPYGLINIGAVGFDLLLNMGGIWWGVVEDIHRWPPIVAIGEMLGGTLGPVRGFWAVGLCALLGVLLCAAPEKLFYDE